MACVAKGQRYNATMETTTQRGSYGITFYRTE